MLEEIRIRGLGVIDDAQLDLGPGLTVVTGETGAGKTMVLTGLGLLMGGRADGGAVRTGTTKAVVEGRIRLDADSEVVRRALEAGAELDDGDLLLSRSVLAEGRSRAHVGGRSVPVGLLTELSTGLIAVHGQSDQQRLLRPARQRSALDRFGGAPVAGPLTVYAERFARLRTVERELDDVITRARERAQEADLLRFGLSEIEHADPQPGEDIALRDEESRLGHADGLRSAAESAHGVLSSDDAGPEQLDALTLLGRARQALDTERGHDAELAALADRLAEAAYLLGDVAADLGSYASSVDTDPERLAVVHERRAALSDLVRKYGDDTAVVDTAVGKPDHDPTGDLPNPSGAPNPPGTPNPFSAANPSSAVDAVLRWAENASARLLELDGDDDRVLALRAEREALRAELHDLAGQLTAARTGAAARFAEAVGAELSALAMPHARVVVDVRPRDELGPHGADDIEILFSAHNGSAPRPLDKGASGGELSRLMLAIEVVFAGSDPVPTFVFDEVDAGVGGKAAVEVGRRLAMLARHAQVLVVTHLPQVAAFADRHLKVIKSDDGRVTSSDVAGLDGDERVLELSRMLAGLEGSATAQAHAEELLATAAAAKAQTGDTQHA